MGPHNHNRPFDIQWDKLDARKNLNIMIVDLTPRENIGGHN